MNKKTAAKIIFSSVLIAALIMLVRFDKAAEALSTINMQLFITATLLVVPLMFSAFARWKLLLMSNGVEVPFKPASLIYMIGMFFSFITPSKIGTLVKFYYLKKNYSIPSGVSFSLALMDKIFDLLIVATVTVTGLFVFSGLSSGALSYLPLLSAVVIIALFFVLFLSKSAFMKVMVPLMSRLKFAGRFFRMGSIDEKKAASDVYEPFSVLRKKHGYLAGVLFFSALYWVIFAAQLTLLMASFGLTIGIITALLIACTSSAVSFIPVSVGGIGTRDASLVYLLSLFGVVYEKAILVSILLFLITQFIMMIAGGLTYMLSGLKAGGKDRQW